jgi:hypothetical protein
VAPKLVAKELHAYSLGLADETGELMRKLKGGGLVGGMDASASARPTGRGPSPPSSNTGGKGTPKGSGGRS